MAPQYKGNKLRIVSKKIYAPRTLGVVNWALIEIKTLKTLPGGEEKLTSK